MTSGQLSFENVNYSLLKKLTVEGKLCICVILKELQILKKKNNPRLRESASLLHAEQN